MLAERVFEKVQDERFRQWLLELLIEICRVDTTPAPDVAKMRAAESAVFDAIERELARLPFDAARTERRPIDPRIAQHPAFSQLHFTKTPDRPEGLSPEQVYAERCNLLFFVDGAGGADAAGLALNGHIDVVAPYFPPRLEGGVLYGRGTCDDKGNVVAMLAALRIVAELCREHRVQLRRPITAMIVVEEETGGNGSLALAIDRELRRRYDELLVLETCGNRVYPANRGAVWYKFEIAGREHGLNDLELAAFVIGELEEEGRAIRAESRHRLFPQRPVQTCQGILDRFGEHPSRICGHVALELQFERPPGAETQQLVRDLVEFAIEEYVGRYGDKTKVRDPVTGEPKVRRHYELQFDGRHAVLHLYGSTGHMGAMFENDDAITKAAWVVRDLVRSRSRLEHTAGGPVRIDLHQRARGERLVLEGGQGFVPTHSIEEVMERMLAAARRGAAQYLARVGRTELAAERLVAGSYEKLHNDAYDGDPESEPMRDALAALKRCGLWRDEPVCGFVASCDARLFAKEYPGMPVLTAGAGRLEDAHSDNERIELEQLYRCVEFLSLFVLKRTAGIELE